MRRGYGTRLRSCPAATWKAPPPRRPSGGRGGAGGRGERAALGKEEPPAPEVYPAVYGCTADDPEPHFLGWLGQVDPDELFATGAAWGVTVRRVAVAE